eukprot:2997972-Amphidinium_carterae.1
MTCVTIIRKDPEVKVCCTSVASDRKCAAWVDNHELQHLCPTPYTKNQTIVQQVRCSEGFASWDGR